MPPSARYRAAPRFSAMGDGFSDIVKAAEFPEKKLRFRNQRWARRVGLDTLTEDEWTLAFADFSPLPDNLPQPLALRYHGHQFDSYNPRLGDGRGFLYAQLLDAEDDRLLDLATKGSGQTPWSRGGDGRLTLKGGVREILATEMLEALGVSTSKTFSLHETGEALQRGDEPSPTRSSILVRLGHSHIRFGTFQRLAYIHDKPAMERLFQYVADNLVPASSPEMLLRSVVASSADLCASWMIAGFVHGVLNSDNMNVTGESFDYGPYRFLPHYDASFTAAYFDHSGLYAFGRQPAAVLRNVERFADALTLLAPVPVLTAELARFEEQLERAVRSRFLARLGVAPIGADEDETLLGTAFDFLATTAIGYDQFYFDWAGGEASQARAASSPDHDAYDGASFLAFRRALSPYTPVDAAQLSHPYFRRERPTTLLIDEVEAVFAPIAERDDWTSLATKIDEIRGMGEAVKVAREPR